MVGFFDLDTYSVKWYVYDNKAKGRVSVHAELLRDSAQAQADSLNISDLVRPHEEDPRDYEVRLAEAAAKYEELKKA